MLKRLVCAPIAAFFFAMSASAAPAAEEKTYNFSPVNQQNLKLSAAYWNPIIEYVSARSGVKLKLKLGRTSADTTAYVLADEVDFAFTNHLFSPERARMGWKVFGRRDAPPVRGQIIVLADSPIKSLQDLAGKDVVFPGREAFLSYKVTYAQLLRHNISAGAVFAGNLDAAFSQLLSGRVPAMGANSQLVLAYSERESKRFRVLWNSPPFHDLALMASPRVPAKDVQAVAEAFFSMRNDTRGKKILAAAGEEISVQVPVGFVAATDADYRNYREVYEDLPPTLR